MAKCEKCGGSGFYQVEEDGETRWAICECRKKKNERSAVDLKLIDACIPKDYLKYSFESYQKLAAILLPPVREFNKIRIAEIQKCIADPKYFFDTFRILWIWGKDANSGHTSLAIEIGKSLIKYGHAVRFVKMPYLTDLMVKFDDKAEEIKKLSTYDVLIIDDAFDKMRCEIKNRDDYKNIQLFNFLSTLLENGKSFICTSNVDLANLDPVFDEIKVVFRRYTKSLEIRGDLTTIIEQMR